LADNYYDFAKKGYADIPLRNRLSIITAGKMYQAIGKQILQNGESQYWQGRVSLGLSAKLKIAGKAIIDEFFAKKQLASSFDYQADLQATIKQAIASYAAK
jgi:hypothetical protein